MKDICRGETETMYQGERDKRQRDDVGWGNLSARDARVCASSSVRDVCVCVCACVCVCVCVCLLWAEDLTRFNRRAEQNMSKSRTFEQNIYLSLPFACYVQKYSS